MHSYVKDEDQTSIQGRESTLYNIKFLLAKILKRLIRIMPLYLVVMCLTEFSATYFREMSVVNLFEGDDYNCRK